MASPATAKAETSKAAPAQPQASLLPAAAPALAPVAGEDAKPAAPVAAALEPKPAETAVVKPQRVMAPSHDIKLLDYGRNSFHVLAPAEHTLEQALDLRYCWHKHQEFKPGDKIEIRHALFHFEIQILVREVDREAQAVLGYYTVRNLLDEELRSPDLTSAVIEQLGAHKWCIRNGAFLLKTGFDTQLEAVAWLAKKQAR